MTQNPYESPKEVGQTATERPRLRFTMALAGLLFGGLCGCGGGFVGGALTGATYRSFHDVVAVHDGLFGRFTRTETLADWALLHGTRAMVPLAVLGGVLGGIQGGLAATRGRLSMVGIGFFAVAGLLVGLVNGGSATLGPDRLFPHFWEGPGAGALFGFLTGAIAWRVFCKRLDRISRDPTRCMPFLLLTGGVIAGGFLIWFATILFGKLGTDFLQVVSGFGVIVSLTILVAVLWAIWNRRIV